MGRDIRDITGRALQRRTKDAMGRALFGPKAGSPHKGEKKHKQGYKAREDESLGMRTGKEAGKRQSMADRRDESYGAWGKRPKGQKINKAKGGTVKKQLGGVAQPVGGATPAVGGATQGYNARLDESLGARHPGATGSMAGRRAMSEGMERSMGRGPYSGARTMAAKGGTIKKQRGGEISATSTSPHEQSHSRGRSRSGPQAGRFGPKSGPRSSGRRGPGGGSKSNLRTATTSFHESQKAALKDKGKPNTPGEKMREIKGGMTMGRIRTKKVLKGDYDLGKKLKYQRRGKTDH